jgi:hypothetical protein
LPPAAPEYLLVRCRAAVREPDRIDDQITESETDIAARRLLSLNSPFTSDTGARDLLDPATKFLFLAIAFAVAADDLARRQHCPE